MELPKPEPRPWMTDAQLEEITWAEAYVDRWADLVFGHFDRHITLENARATFASKGHLSPWRVANEDFDGMDTKADYLPGGTYWRRLEQE